MLGRGMRMRMRLRMCWLAGASSLQYPAPHLLRTGDALLARHADRLCTLARQGAEPTAYGTVPDDCERSPLGKRGG